MIVRPDDLIGQAHFADQLHGPGLRRHETVWTGFQYAALLDGGLDHATGAAGFLDERRPDSSFVEIVGCRKAWKFRRR